jgi:hypothetical protein
MGFLRAFHGPRRDDSGVEMPLFLPSVSKIGVGVERFELIEAFDFKAGYIRHWKTGGGCRIFRQQAWPSF